MLFPDCRMVHTFLMRFPIDVLFLDNEYGILKIYRALEPWHIAFCLRPGRVHTLETAADAAARLNLRPGQRLAARLQDN